MTFTSREVPIHEWRHTKGDRFKIVFGPVTYTDPDTNEEIFYDLTSFVPVFQILKLGIVVLTISGADIALTENNEFVIVKSAVSFTPFDRLGVFTYRFFNSATDETVVKGPFKFL